MKSSVIRSFDYDPSAMRLAITFQTGRRYVYLNVPDDVAAGLRAAPSQGEYFNAAIRDRYAYRRLRGPA